MCRLKALLFGLCLYSTLHFLCEYASANEKHSYNRERILCLTIRALAYDVLRITIRIISLELTEPNEE